MVDYKKILFGLLTILVATGIIYVNFQGKVQIRVDEDKSTFYVNDSGWKVAGKEYVRLFNGSTLVNRVTSGIEIWNETIGQDYIIYRKTPYSTGTVIISKYVFDSQAEDIELFPKEESHTVVNGTGLSFRYSLDELKNVSPKRKLTTETSLLFGYNMKVTFPSGYSWAWLGYPYGSDSFSAQYKVESDYQKFDIRFFDPVDSNYNQFLTAGYPFDFNASDVKYGYSSVLIGDAHINETSPLKGAGSLQGDGSNDGLNFTRQHFPNSSADFCASYWFKTTATTTDFLGMHQTNSTSGDCRFILFNTRTIASNVTLFFDSANQINSPAKDDGNWHHVVANRKNQNFSLWVDGVLIGNYSSTTAICAANTTVGEFSTIEFRNNHDEMMFFNTSCSAAMIQDLYQDNATVGEVINSSNVINYYFAQNGSDSNDGLSPDFPKKTIAAHNALTLNQNFCYSFNFQRGDVWNSYEDDFIEIKSGSINGTFMCNSTYQAYGNQARNKPRITGFVNLSNANNWTSLGGTVWESKIEFSRDVGELYCDNFQRFGNKTNETRWTQQGRSSYFYLPFLHNVTGNDTILINSTNNPATNCSGFLLAVFEPNSLGAAIIDIQEVDRVIFKDFEIMGSGAHGIAGSNNGDITIDNNTVKYIGGSFHVDGNHSECVNCRYGNGIQYGNSNNRSRIIRNNVSDAIDACYTLQDFTSGSIGRFQKVNISDNLGFDCIYPWEYFNSGAANSFTENITLAYNTFVKYTGNHWNNLKGFDRERWESTPNGVLTANISHTNNILAGSTFALIALGSSNDWDGLIQSGMFDYDAFATVNGSDQFTINGSVKTRAQLATLGQEVNGNYFNSTDNFVNYTIDDFRPVSTSILCNMSVNGGRVGALPCLDINPEPVQNASVLFVSNQSIYFNWTQVVDSLRSKDSNGTMIFRNGVNIANITTNNKTYNDTGLTNGTTYRYDLLSLDWGKNKGTNITLTNTTLQHGQASALNLSLELSDNNQTYELGSHVYIVANGTGTLCFDIFHPGYGIGYNCSSAANVQNISFPEVYYTRFNDSSEIKALAAAGKHTSVIADNESVTEFVNYSFYVNGSNNEFRNLTIDIGDDGRLDYRIPGKLYMNSLIINSTTNGLDREAYIFTGSDRTLLRIFDLPGRRYAYTLRINVTGQQFLDNVTLNFSNNNFKDSDNTESNWSNSDLMLRLTPTQKPWDFQTTVDSSFSTTTDGSSASTVYNAFDSNLSTYVIFNDAECGSSGCSSTEQNNIWAYNVTNQTLMTVKYRVQCGGGSAGGGSGTESFQVYDWTMGTFDTIQSVTCLGGGAAQDSGDVTLSWNLSGSQAKYKNSSNTVLFLHLWSKSGGGGDSISGSMYLYQVSNANSTQYDGRGSQQTTTLSMFDSTFNITNVTINTSVAEPASTAVAMSISVNNGGLYESIVYENVTHQFNSTTSGRNIRLRFILSTTNKTRTPVVNRADLINLLGEFPENLTIDLGDDSELDFIYNRTLNTTTVINLTVNLSTPLINYYNTNCNSTLYVRGCQFPVRFSTKSSGKVQVNWINMSTTAGNSPTDSRQYMNITRVNQLCTVKNCEIKSLFNWSGVANGTVSGLALGYYGDGNVTIVARDTGNTLNETLVAKMVYSNYNYTFPFRVDYLEFIPLSAQSKNVSPYGQSNSTPIFNITMLPKGMSQGMNFSVIINETVSCVNYTISTTSRKQDGVQLNTTSWVSLFSNRSYLNKTRIWMFADYHCNSSSGWMYFVPSIYFRGCVHSGTCSEQVR